jgi:hypothetical protein
VIDRIFIIIVCSLVGMLALCILAFFVAVFWPEKKHDKR